MSNEHHMRQAIALSLQMMRSNRGGPFGAVIVKDGQIIAEGANQVTSTNDPTAHAEIVALRHACQVLGTFDLTGCEIYTNCEPCPMCLGAIYWARPKLFYYASTREQATLAGFDDAYIYDQVALPPPDRTIPGFRLLPQAGQRPFSQWAQSANRLTY